LTQSGHNAYKRTPVQFGILHNANGRKHVSRKRNCLEIGVRTDDDHDFVAERREHRNRVMQEGSSADGNGQFVSRAETF
jgi:hypothetical protein